MKETLIYKREDLHMSRQKWLEEECVFTGSCNCDYCPYVVYDENGSRKCEKEVYEECRGKEES